MIKTITLASALTLAILFVPAQAEGNKCTAGKCGAGMMKKNKGGHKMGHGAALLLMLPSPMRMIMKHENDPKLALTAEQKSKLEVQRNKMMPQMMKLKKEIKVLSKETRVAFRKSGIAAEQKDKIEKLAKLKTEATMLKLTCIEGVKASLSKEQQAYMKELRKEKMAKMKEKMKGMKNENSAKCAGNK